MKKVFALIVLALVVVGSICVAGCTSSDTQNTSSASSSNSNVITTVTLGVSSNPGGAKVWLDDVYIDRTPFSISGVSVGSHKIRITKDGYEDYETVIYTNNFDDKTRHSATLKKKI